MNKKYLNYAEDFAIILGFLFFSGALSNLDIFPSKVLSLVRWMITFGSLVMIAARSKLLLHKFRRDVFIFAVIFLAVISYNWSDFPIYSFNKVKSELFPMTIFGLYLGVSFDIKTLFKKSTLALIIGLLLSWFAAFAMPSVGRVHTGPFAGAWTGVYGHKNASSSYMVLTALTLILSSLRRSSQRWMGIYRHLWIRGLGISAFGFIFLTTSGTGLVLSFLIAFNLLLYSQFRWRGKVTVLLLDIGVLVVGSLAIIILGNWNGIVTGMGKDPTLTGRTIFWTIGIDSLIEQQPFFGFGKSGFWAPASDYVQEISIAFGGGYVPPHAHNGFIELALDIGVVGLGLFAISFFLTWARVLQQGYNTREMENLFPLGFMILFLVNNITESYTFYFNHMFWPLYIAIALNAGKARSSRSLKANKKSPMSFKPQAANFKV